MYLLKSLPQIVVIAAHNGKFPAKYSEGFECPSAASKRTCTRCKFGLGIYWPFALRA